MTLGEKIQKLRQEQNISQKELAVKLGVSTADIAVWEADESIPSIADIAKLSSALGVTTDALIMDSEIASDETSRTTKAEVVEKEIQPIELPSDKKAKISKKKLAVLISLSVMVVAVIGIFAYKLFLPFSKNTSAIEKATSSVVKIYCYDYEGNESATGSGFIALNDRTVITNYHVMEDAYTCKVSTDEDKTYVVESILAYSKEQDLAIIRLKESTGLKVLELGDSEKIKKGETVTAIGSPLGLKNTVSQGVLSGRLMEENMDVLQFTAAISGGSSGGALFDESGKIVGVTYASYVDGQNLNLAIPSECVKSLHQKPGSNYPVNVVYLSEHPYVKFLDDYENILEVTLDDLKKEPSFYNGKIIKINTYISSKYKVIDKYNIWNFSDKNDVGGNYDYDNENEVYNENFIDRRILDGCDWAEALYVDNELQVGDNVIVIGEFSFFEKGHDEIFYRDTAFIDVDLIFKK